MRATSRCATSSTCAVPAEPLPRLNDTRVFREGIIGGALSVLNEWWATRERPTEGLHGASLETGS